MSKNSTAVIVGGLVLLTLIGIALAWTFKPAPGGSRMDSEYEGTDHDDSTPLPEGEHRPWMDFQKPPSSELRTRLTPLQYSVTQENGTERSFQNEYWDNHREGIYVDVVSGEPLFSSLDKFDSGTGWPSFTRPLEPGNIVEIEDRSLGLVQGRGKKPARGLSSGACLQRRPAAHRPALLHQLCRPALHPQRGDSRRGVR